MNTLAVAQIVDVSSYARSISRSMTLKKITSGGQTGVDRGALDAALQRGFSCGGWCPPGRMAEDGPIPGQYPMTEMPRGGYRARTIQNVVDSDGTVIIHFGELEGGTEQTRLHAARRGKPSLLINAAETVPERAAELIAAFIAENSIATLNVAGPRASRQPTAHGYALAVVSKLLPRAINT
jgi:hypothetical protein